MLLNGWKEQEMKLTQSTQNQASLVSWRESVPPNIDPATCPSALTQGGETVSEKEWGSMKWEIPETHGNQCQLWSKWYLFIVRLKKNSFLGSQSVTEPNTENYIPRWKTTFMYYPKIRHFNQSFKKHSSRIQKLHCDIWLKQYSLYFHPCNEQTFREEDSITSQHSRIISVPRARSLWKPHCFKKHFCPQPCSLLTNLQSSDDHKESRIQKIYYNVHEIKDKYLQP